MNSGGKWALIGVGIAAVAIVSVVAWSGGRQPVACPAVGHVITVGVRITGDASAVHDVRLCTTGGCSAPAADSPGAGGGSVSATPQSGASAPASGPSGGGSGASFPEKPTGPEIPAPTAPAAPAGDQAFAVPQLLPFADTLPRTWTFDTRGQYPTRVSASAYGADGRRIGSRVADLRWHRFAPGDVCDVSKVTGAVALPVGS